MRGRAGLIVALLLACIALWTLVRGVHEERATAPAAPEVNPRAAERALELPAVSLPEATALAPDPESDPQVQASMPAPADVVGPTIIGRILLPDGWTPAVGATVRLDDLRPGMPFEDLRSTTDAHGRFAIHIDPPRDIEEAELLIGHEASHSFHASRRDDLDGQFGTDLGDIVLKVLRTLHLRVIDEAGNPVTEARATTLGEGVAWSADEIRSQVTDANGILRLEPVPADCESIEIWARGFLPKRVALPEPLTSALLTASLDHGPVLRIRVRHPEGPLPEGLQLRLESDSQPFVGARPDQFPGRESLPSIAASVGMSGPPDIYHPPGPDGSRSDAVTCSCLVGPEGEIELFALRSGLDLGLSVLSDAGESLWGPEHLTLQPREEREIEVMLGDLGRRVVVRTLDPQGEPVVSAFVFLKPADGSGGVSVSGAQGDATFEAIRADRATIAVVHDDWACVVLTDRDLVEGVPIDVTLRPGVAVDISLVDAAGQPAEADHVMVSLDGFIFPRVLDPDAPATFSTTRLTGLPPGIVRLMIKRGVQSCSREIDARLDQATVTVPWSFGDP